MLTFVIKREEESRPTKARPAGAVLLTARSGSPKFSGKPNSPSDANEGFDVLASAERHGDRMP
jgi:hypothetical protein